MRRLLALPLLLAAVLGLAPAAQAQDAPPPGLGVRLVEAPRALADDPRAQVYVVDHVIPGATVERRIEISNGDDAPMDVELYGVAADVARGWVVADGRGGNDLATWIAVEPARVTLAPGERREALVTIRVPGDAGGGERYAAVVAETRGLDAGSGVELVSRVGIRVYLSVGGGPAPQTDFVIDTLTAGRAEDGTPYLLVEVTNTGGRAIDVTGEVALTDGPGRLSAGPFPVAIPRTIGPGATGAVQVPMDRGIPDGPWLATAHLRSGLVERSAEATVRFPAPGAVADPVGADPVEAQRRVLLPLALILLLVVSAALLFVLLARRRRDDEDDERHDGGAAGAPEPTRGDASGGHGRVTLRAQARR